MALFGSDAAQYVTPDGRTVTLPSQIADQFPGLSPVSAGQGSIGTAPGTPQPLNEIAAPGPGAPPPGNSPPALPSGGAPSFPPDAQAGLAALTPQPTPEDAANAPVVSPSQVPDGGGAQATRGPVTEPGAVPDAGPPNRDTPTQAQLTKFNEADRVAGESRALDQQADATRAQGAAQVNKDTQIGDLQLQAAKDAAEQTAARQKAAQDMEAAQQKRLDGIEAYSNKILNTKVDRELDHPVLAQIGIILGAIGQTLNRSDRNLALEAFYKAVDRKVAGQMQNLDNMRGNLSMMRDQYGMQKDMNRNRLDDMDAHRIASLDDATKKITAMGTQLESPIAKANMQAALADIAQKKQAVYGNAGDRIKAELMAAQARNDRINNEAANRAVTMRGQNMEDRRFYYGQQQQEKEHMATIAAQYLERGDKLNAEKAKRAAELGIIDPSTGDMILTPEGQSKMSQADQVEAAARKATDPAQAQKLTQQANDLRDSARMNDAALAPTTKGAEAAQKIMAETTNAQKNIDAAREMLKAGPSAFNKEEWAKIVVALQGVKVNYAQTMGERMSPKALEAIDDIVGIDPNVGFFAGSGLYERAFNKDKAIAALGQIETQMKSGASTALLANGVKTPWSPARPLDNVEDKIGSGGQGDRAGQTAAEAAKDAEPTTWQRIGGRIVNPIGGYDGLGIQDRAFDRASQAPGVDNSGRALPPSNYGIDPADDARVRSKIAESAKVGNRKYGQIVDTLAQPLVSDRPGLATGVARLINDEDPKLLNDVLARVAASPGGGEQKAKALAEAARGVAQKVDAIGQFGPPPGPVPAYRPPAPPLPPGALAPPPPPQHLPITLSTLKQLTPAQQTQYKEWLDANGFLP